MHNLSFSLEGALNGTVAGIDEAGCGAWAGPVVAAAVMFSKENNVNTLLPYLNDSKKLSKRQREIAYNLIWEEKSILVGVGVSSQDEIDQLNIRQATLKAMIKAVDGLSQQPDHLLVDGLSAPKTLIPCQTITKGDQKSFSIAAASIIAKVTRDQIMADLDRLYPGYGLETNVGYGTKSHLEALRQKGVTSIHRKSYKPIQQLQELMPLV